GAGVGAAEAEVARLRAEVVDLAQHLALGRDLDDRALGVASHVEVPVDVAAHAVEAEVGELDQEALVGEGAVGLDIEGPDVALDALVDVKRLTVGADVEAVGGAHTGGDAGDAAVAV